MWETPMPMQKVVTYIVICLSCYSKKRAPGCTGTMQLMPDYPHTQSLQMVNSNKHAITQSIPSSYSSFELPITSSAWVTCNKLFLVGSGKHS